MPSGGDDFRFPFRAARSEEIDGFVVGIGQADWHNQVAYPHVDFRKDEACDVELFQSNFTAFFNFHFVFSVFCVFYLIGTSRTSSLKFYFCS